MSPEKTLFEILHLLAVAFDRDQCTTYVSTKRHSSSSSTYTPIRFAIYAKVVKNSQDYDRPISDKIIHQWLLLLWNW